MKFGTKVEKREIKELEYLIIAAHGIAIKYLENNAQ